MNALSTSFPHNISSFYILLTILSRTEEYLIKDIPVTQEIHVVLDNYCTHKRNEDWLQAHPNVMFHFMPTSASCLNMVEIWLGILTRKALRGGNFNNTEDLKQAIEDFCEVYNQNPKPFVWKKREVKGAQLRNTVANLLE